MKSYRGVLIVFVSAAVLMVIGCVSALKTAKPPDESTSKENAKVSTEQPREDQTAKKPSGEDLKKLLAPPPRPQYNPPTEGEQKASAESEVDSAEKERISQAALEFSSHVKNVKHVKICYSKLYGGWYLMTYLQKGKKMSLDQYSWNNKSQEWEIVYHLKEIPQKQIEFHLKGEVGDEKCFVLK